MSTFPDDENGDVLRRMQAHGDNLSKPRDIEFHFIFATEQQAFGFARQMLATPDVKASPRRYEDQNMWQTTVTKHMIPAHQDITAWEEILSQLAQPFDGKPDGWGCFQVD